MAVVSETSIVRSGGPAGRSRRLRMLRAGSGIVMMVFITLHFSNTALALISLEAAEAGRRLFLGLWRNPVGTVLFYGSLAVHFALVLHALYGRRTLRMPPKEAIQIIFGLAVPLLVVDHVAGTRIFHELTDVRDSYHFVAHTLWWVAPAIGAKQAAALVIVWVHGCLGCFYLIRFRPWYPRLAPWLLAAATVLPTLALLGFAAAGRSATAPEPTTIDPETIRAGQAAVAQIDMAVYAVTVALIALVLAARGLRGLAERRNRIRVAYADGRSVSVPKNTSVLEASRIAGIPHHSVCGGRGRCSTCRVRILQGLASLPEPGDVEAATLKRIGADRDVRLACQLRPDHDLIVAPLVAADSREALALSRLGAAPGREQDVAILFCDIRGFTALSDRRLPFDVVFLLNRYFAAVGQSVERSGGRLDKFIGDGAMAIFGLDGDREEACRQAIAAAGAIVDELARVSAELAAELPAPLRVAIGIHAGPAIVGSMGYGRTMTVTAIGDTVNIASRLESAAKEFDACLVVSETAVALSGIDLGEFAIRRIEIRGRSRPLAVRVVPQGDRVSIAPAKTPA